MLTAAEIQYADVGSAEIAYRRVGNGPLVLFIHGWPLSGLTWRHVVDRLAPRWSCVVTDSPGAGDTRYRADHDFTFRGQAEAYARFLDRLGVDQLDIVAHDTGATIARELALLCGARIRKLVMINTEIPNHRPPFIQAFQRATRLPGAAAVFRALLRSRRFLRSSAGFGGCFSERSLLEGEFHELFVQPMLRSKPALVGQLRYLQGIDWKLVDSLEHRHREIVAETLLVWGEDDPTFPLARAREMMPQLARCAGLRVVPAAKLLVHEERPDAVAGHVLDFLG